MKKIISIFVCSVVITSCQHSQKNVPSISIRLDSVVYYNEFFDASSVYAGEELLFKLVSGGDEFIIADSLISNSESTYQLFMMSTSGQDDMIHFILYDYEGKSLSETENVILPHYGIDPSVKFSYENANVGRDSLSLTSAGIVIKTKILPIGYDEQKVVNYHEME